MGPVRKAFLFTSLFIFLCTGFLVLAQTPDTATLRGQVVDQSRAAVGDVQLSVSNALKGLRRTANTDHFGNFSIVGLPVAGAYTITAAKTGFADATVENVSLVAGSTAEVSIQMNASGGRTEITVTSVAGEVRTDNPQLGTDLDVSTMEETPLLNRRITTLPLL